MRRRRYADLLARVARRAEGYPYLCRTGALPWTWVPPTAGAMERSTRAGALVPAERGVFVLISEHGTRVLAASQGGAA